MDSANLRLVHVHVQRPPHQQHERRMCLHCWPSDGPSPTSCPRDRPLFRMWVSWI